MWCSSFSKSLKFLTVTFVSVPLTAMTTWKIRYALFFNGRIKFKKAFLEVHACKQKAKH